MIKQYAGSGHADFLPTLRAKWTKLRVPTNTSDAKGLLSIPKPGRCADLFKRNATDPLWAVFSVLFDFSDCDSFPFWPAASQCASTLESGRTQRLSHLILPVASLSQNGRVPWNPNPSLSRATGSRVDEELSKTRRVTGHESGLLWRLVPSFLPPVSLSFGVCLTYSK